MASTYHEVPALPVVVPVVAVAFGIMLWRLHGRAAMSVPRAAVAATTCAYAAGIVANTLFPIRVGGADYHESWRVFINLTPLAGTEPFDMLTNVAVFVPLGFLLPLIVRASSARRVLLIGFSVSLAMETLQFINAVTGHGGHVADVNDLLANTLGAPIGYGVFRGAQLLPVVGRWIDGAMWLRPHAQVGMPPTPAIR